MSTDRSRGFAMITALFLVVALAIVGTAVTVVSVAQQRTQASDVLGAQAYQAARAGVEYGLYQTLRVSGCTGAPWNLTPTQWNGRFRVNITCTQSDQVENSVQSRLYEIVATACSGPTCPGTGGASYIERQLRVTIEGPGI
jgi:MSHA biogenesis protein MshP